MRAVTHSSARGYTAVQLLIVMAVIGILATIGLPSFQHVLEWQQATTRVHLLTSHLAMARSMAVTQRAPVSVCPSAEGATCRSDRIWSQGWILFKDPNRQGQPADTASILRATHYQENSGIDVTASLGRPIVRFLPSGRSSGSNITLSVCRNATKLVDVIVNNAGRTRAVRYTTPAPCRPR